MKLFNIIHTINKNQTDLIDKYIIHEGYSILLRSLAPICPHITHYLWAKIGHSIPIIQAHWPKVSKDALKSKLVEFVVQINGKLRGHININPEDQIKDIEKQALSQDFVKNHTKDKKHKKSIVLPTHKLVNLVFIDK